MCASSPPSKSLSVLSKTSCTTECHFKQYQPTSCVGFNYRVTNNTCDIFIEDPTEFKDDDNGCQYYEVVREYSWGKLLHGVTDNAEFNRKIVAKLLCGPNFICCCRPIQRISHFRMGLLAFSGEQTVSLIILLFKLRSRTPCPRMVETSQHVYDTINFKIEKVYSSDERYTVSNDCIVIVIRTR